MDDIMKPVNDHAGAESALNDGLGLLPRIEAHIRQLAPHMMNRDGVVLLKDAAAEIVKLKFALSDIADMYDDNLPASRNAMAMYDASCVAKEALTPNANVTGLAPRKDAK